MEVIHERVAGLDVHKDSVVACVRIMSGGMAKRECRTFGTTTAELEALRDRQHAQLAAAGAAFRCSGPPGQLRWRGSFRR